MFWLYKAVKLSRKDLEYNTRGVPGEHVGPDVFPGQTSLFLPKIKRKRKINVREKDYNQRNSENRDRA